MIDTVEGLVEFLVKISELRVATLEVQLRTENPILRQKLGLCSGHIKAIIDFTAILASAIEAANKDQYRGREEFEFYSELHQDVPPYTNIEDVRLLTEAISTDFQTLFKAYYRELSDLNMLQFPRLISFNLNEIKHCLSR